MMISSCFVLTIRTAAIWLTVLLLPLDLRQHLQQMWLSAVLEELNRNKKRLVTYILDVLGWAATMEYYLSAEHYYEPDCRRWSIWRRPYLSKDLVCGSLLHSIYIYHLLPLLSESDSLNELLQQWLKIMLCIFAETMFSLCYEIAPVPFNVRCALTFLMPN